MAIESLLHSLLPVILTCHDLLRIVSANSMLFLASGLHFRLLSWACLRNIYGEKQALAVGLPGVCANDGSGRWDPRLLFLADGVLDCRDYRMIVVVMTVKGCGASRGVLIGLWLPTQSKRCWVYLD